MTDQCFMCGYGEEALDDIPLCHWCYEAFADPDSPFCAKHLVNPAFWKVLVSDPDARMMRNWIHKRMESVVK
jgi:hypothetical protein